MIEPKLRFPEFNSNWTHDNLENVAEIFDGTHQTPLYTKTGVQFVSVENIEDIYKSEKYISHEEYDKYKSKPQINDILMTRITAGVIGKTAMVTKDIPLAYYVSLALIRCEKLFPSYVEKYIHSIQFRKELYKRIIHTAFPKKINLGDIGKCLVGITNEQEQQKIAEFLSTIDTVIEKQKETISAWEERKKGVMQKLFSQEVRFKADDGNEFPKWKEKKLGDICAPLTYGMNTAAVKYDGENKYIRITDIDDESHLYKNNELVSPEGELDDKYLVSENDILLARTGASVGKSYLYDKKDGKLYYAGFLIKAHVKSENSKFIFYQTLTDRYARWVQVTSMRSGQPGINANEYSEFMMYVPCLTEQQKIADCLSSLDEVIKKQKATLAAWEELKKGLLQQMFI